MKLTPEQIRDYEACPRFYDFAYGKKGVSKLTKRQQLSLEFMDTIKRVANYYFYKKQSYNDPTLKSLYNRWQKDWFGETTAVDIAKAQNSVQQRSRTAFSTRAVEVIKNLYEDFEDVKADQIFWLNESYVVPILDKRTVVEGNIDLVIRNKEKATYSVFKWAHSNESIQHWQNALVASDYAFKYRYNDMGMDVRHYLWNFYGSKIGRQRVEIEQKDFDLFTYHAQALVNDEVYASRLGFSTYCKSCPYTNKCIKWQMPKEEKV